MKFLMFAHLLVDIVVEFELNMFQFVFVFNLHKNTTIDDETNIYKFILFNKYSFVCAVLEF
jgi:hypothetical protein